MKKQKMKIPKSLKIYIRRQKASIRRSGADLSEKEKQISALYESLGFSKAAE